MKKLFIFLLILILSVATALYYFTQKQSGTARQSDIAVKRGTVTETALAIGEIVPEQEISIKSKVRGILKEKFVEVGDTVKKGDSLTEVNPDPTPIEYAQAKRNMELAKIAMVNAKNESERISQLHKKEWTSLQEYDNFKQIYDETTLRYEMAKENFDLISKGKIKMEGQEIDNIIRAPINGTVLEFLVNEGDPVVPLTTYQEGTPLMTVADMNTLFFKGTIDEIDVGKIDEGVPADITIGAIPDETFAGTVKKIAPKARKENNTTLFDIEITLTHTNLLTLRAGYSATAKIVIACAENVLVVPERVIFYSNDTSYVEVELHTETEKEKPTTVVRKVETGISDGMNTEIKTGVAEGELLIERIRR